MAQAVFEKYGYGEYLSLHFGWCHNKRFSKTFECLGATCPFMQNHRCRKWRTFKKGDDCKRNLRTMKNWVVYAHFTIIPANNQRGWDLIWKKKADKYKTRCKHFWKDA